MKFKIITDRPLIWFFNVTDSGFRLIRWRLKLEKYDYEIVHKTGKGNTNADALSRNPIPDDTFVSTERTKKKKKKRQENIQKKKNARFYMSIMMHLWKGIKESHSKQNQAQAQLAWYYQRRGRIYQ